MSVEDLDFSTIEEKLENPANIQDLERRQIMERVDRHYQAAREYEEVEDKRYELECAEKELERHEWELGVVRP